MSERPLPYTDIKPVGAADFYFAINATFRFIHNKLGDEGLRRYWVDLGERYYSNVSVFWQRGGLHAISRYWQAFFAAEPGAAVDVHLAADCVTLDVRTCSAIAHLREHQRSILPCFCQHCYFVSEAMAKPAGFAVRIEGGNGSCRQMFFKRAAGVPEQDLSRIKEAS